MSNHPNFSTFFSAPPFDVRTCFNERWGVNLYEIATDIRFAERAPTSEWWTVKNGEAVFRTVLIPPSRFILSTASAVNGAKERRSWFSIVSLLSSLPRILFEETSRGSFNVFAGYFDLYFREMAKTHWKGEWMKDDKVWRLRPGGVPKEALGAALSSFSRRRKRFLVDDTSTTTGAFQMKKYQMRAVSRIKTWGEDGMNGFLIAHDPGLGKTRTALSVASGFLSADDASRGAVVLAPQSTLAQWRNTSFDVGLSAEISHGSEKKDIREISPDTQVVITTSDYAFHNPERLVDAVKLCENRLLILDEAVHYKNPESKSFKAAALMAMASKFVAMLSGTPVENHIGELEALVLLGEPRVFPKREFAALHEVYGEKEVYIPSQKKCITRRTVSYVDATKFGERVAPFIDRERHDGDEASVSMPVLEHEDIEVLPGFVEMEVERIVRDEYMKIYKEAFNEDLAFREAYRGNSTPGASVLTHLQMALFDPHVFDFLETDSEILLSAVERIKREGTIPAGYFGAKARALVELLDKPMVASSPSIVFTCYSGVAKRAAEILKSELEENRPVFLITGATTRKTRLSILDEASKTRNGVIVSTGAMSMGVEIKFARSAIHIDMPWTPAQMDQRTDRIHRIGALGTGRVFRLICPNSVDTKKLGIHKKKRTAAENALAASSPFRRKDSNKNRELAGESFIF